MSKKSRALLMLMTPQDDGVGGPGVVPWDIDKNRKFKCACGHTVELPLDMLRYRERLDESTGEIIKEVYATPLVLQQVRADRGDPRGETEEDGR
jgi:hypothetical protein